MSLANTLKKSFKTHRRKLKRKIHTFPLWYDEPEFIFIHINKTGGSSIEMALNLPFEHLTAVEKINQVGQEKWNQKFTFSFVRNPFDKVYSHYRYRVKTNQTRLKNKPMSFSDWVKVSYSEKDPYYHDNPKMFYPQSQWLCDRDNNLLVDQVYRFEKLHDDFNQLRTKFNLEVRLPHLKASSKVDYRDYYDEATQQIVQKHFASDLQRFGYNF